MFKNQYDTDITTWSPDGKLYQVEYSMEAVKQGSCAVGLKNKNFVVLGSLKRTPHVSLSSYQGKLFQISDQIGIAIAGLAADGRVLCKYLRRETLYHEYVYSSPINVTDLVNQVGDKSQKNTQFYGRRAFGVGLLVSGFSNNKPKLYQTSPCGKVFDYKGIAIGARSQSARTFIEKNIEAINNSEKEKDLLLFALRALKKTTTENVDLTLKNTELSIVGKGMIYNIIDSENNTKKLRELLDILEKENEEKEKEREEKEKEKEKEGEKDEMVVDEPTKE